MATVVTEKLLAESDNLEVGSVSLSNPFQLSTIWAHSACGFSPGFWLVHMLGDQKGDEVSWYRFDPPA